MPKSSKCWHYEYINIAETANCTNCQHWDPKKNRCKDEALIIAEYDKRHRSYELMMQSNKGLRLNG
jgi:hypothetical protein